MRHAWNEPTTARTAPALPTNRRASERRDLNVPARLMWKDSRGTARFATVVTRDISDTGVFVESQSIVSIPLYRIVQFQFEQDAVDIASVPLPLRRGGRILSAVYRVSPPTRNGGRQGFALRLMVDPTRAAAPSQAALSA